jgi:hypothetical protein
MKTPEASRAAGENRMSTTNPKLQTVPLHPLSRKQIRRYFYPKPIAYWPYITAALGVMLPFMGWVTHIWPFIFLSIIPLVIGATFIYHGLKTNPDDVDFDRWVEGQAKELATHGMHSLCLSRKDLVDTPIRIVSYVLPGSRTAAEYMPQQVHMKQGKDGQWRFSIYVYTYIYPTANYLAVYRGDINVFSTRRIEQDETYLYQHIYSASLRASRDTLAWEESLIPYRIEQLCLKIFNGDVVELSAAIKAMPQEQADDAPLESLPNPSFERTLMRLRQLLHSRNKLV